MLELKTKQKLAQEAHKLASSYSLVRFRSNTYVPADYETLQLSPPPVEDRTVWLPIPRDELRLMAADQFQTLFASDSELNSFDFMVSQHATLSKTNPSSMLIRTEDGLKLLTEAGTLADPTGDFIPNYVKPMLNNDPDDKQFVYDTIVEWVNSKEDADSLLNHLATMLSPGWSAVKYILLLGVGRNGKGVLIKMLHGLVGSENISHVTRQHMAENNPVVTELNGKLLNLIYDGQAEYLKDTGTEKSLVAGEPVPIRKLYDSNTTTVQTNALFVEGLNHEPKSKDKSSALQKRLVRYHFSNVYPLNRAFEKKMTSEKMLGAFLSLLIDHYVLEDELAEKLALTSKAMELQLEHMFTNSIGLQFLKNFDLVSAGGIDDMVGLTIDDLVQKFRAWRLAEGDSGQWAEPDIVGLFDPLVETDRVSKRVNGKPRKVRAVRTLRPEARSFIENQKEDEDAELLDAVVEE
jgi:hypothetical protein